MLFIADNKYVKYCTKHVVNLKMHTQLPKITEHFKVHYRFQLRPPQNAAPSTADNLHHTWCYQVFRTCPPKISTVNMHQCKKKAWSFKHHSQFLDFQQYIRRHLNFILLWMLLEVAHPRKHTTARQMNRWFSPLIETVQKDNKVIGTISKLNVRGVYRSLTFEKHTYFHHL